MSRGRSEVQRHHGTVVKHTGDGALATFASGSEAIAAAIDLRSTTRDLGLAGRTGIHVGEVERRGDDIGGIDRPWNLYAVGLPQ